MTGPVPILTVIADHRAAYDAFQVVPDGEPSIDANCALSDALYALVVIACTFPILSQPLPEDAEALLAHLRWWLAEEAVHASDYQPQYRIIEARAADLALVLELPSGVGCDPVFASIAAADAAAAAHTASLADLDEDDDAQMWAANAAAHAASVAFEVVERTMPTTWGGLLALVDFYGRDLELYDRCSHGGGYFQHLAAAMRGCESTAGFWLYREHASQSDASVPRPIPPAEPEFNERVAA